jgi:hypothetical protein
MEGGGKDYESDRDVEQMGWVSKAGLSFFFMSFWSVGVAVERIYTFSQAASSRGSTRRRWPSTSRKAG